MKSIKHITTLVLIVLSFIAFAKISYAQGFIEITSQFLDQEEIAVQELGKAIFSSRTGLHLARAKLADSQQNIKDLEELKQLYIELSGIRLSGGAILPDKLDYFRSKLKVFLIVYAMVNESGVIKQPKYKKNEKIHNLSEVERFIWNEMSDDFLYERIDEALYGNDDSRPANMLSNEPVEESKDFFLAGVSKLLASYQSHEFMTAVEKYELKVSKNLDSIISFEIVKILEKYSQTMSRNEFLQLLYDLSGKNEFNSIYIKIIRLANFEYEGRNIQDFILEAISLTRLEVVKNLKLQQIEIDLGGYDELRIQRFLKARERNEEIPDISEERLPGLNKAIARIKIKTDIIKPINH